jgi:hypothetical protein
MTTQAGGLVRPILGVPAANDELLLRTGERENRCPGRDGIVSPKYRPTVEHQDTHLHQSILVAAHTLRKNGLNSDSVGKTVFVSSEEV